MAKNNTGVISNVSWKLAERLTAQIVTTVVSIVLARILNPSDYGIVAIVTIFITFANVFVSDGFGSALIQKKDADDLDFSSVLVFNFIFSIILYIILFLAAPAISMFYGKDFEILIPVLRVLGLRIIVASINSVQQAYVSKKMIFRKFFLATFLGTVASAFVGIWMAYNGYGVWALVGQYLTNTTIDTIVLGISLRWWPGFKVSFKRLKGLLKFGWKILGSSILTTLFVEVRSLIIGKIYSKEDLSFYDKGKQFPNLIVTNINASLSAVLFSKMSSEQNDLSLVKQTTRNSIRVSSYIMFPLMTGMLAVSEPFVSVVLTSKWLPCVPLMQWFCVVYLFQPVHSANMQAIKAIGRSDVFLILEIIKKTIELITLVIFMWFGVNAIVISLAGITTLFLFINAYPNKKLLNYSIKEQMLDILPSLLMAVAMGVCVWLITLLPINRIIVLVVQVALGVSMYLLSSIITRNKEYQYLKNTVSSKFKRKRD